MPGTEWSPERHRRRALAAVLVGHQGSDRYGNQTKRGRGGNGGGAHSGCSGGLGKVGDGPEPTNLTVMAGGSEVEDEPGEVVRGLLEGRGSVRWVEDGVAELLSSAGGRGVAGGCGNRRRRRWWRVGGAAGESREGGEEYRGSEKGQGLRGVADGVQGDEGKAASRRWPGHRQRSPPSCFGARGGRRQEKGWAGPCWRSWAR